MSAAASFAPVHDARTRLLILGSLPGRQSLAEQRYYAHPRNQFWPLLGAVLDADLVALPYAARLDRLRDRGVGLWDVIGVADRIGSLDAAIRNPRPNALAGLAALLPNLAAIACNGATAYRLARPLLAMTGLPLLALPSSSPAYAAMPFAAKRECWLALRGVLAGD